MTTPNPTPGAILKALTPGKFETIAKVSPIGSLQARKQSTGAVFFYWRYSIGTKSERVPLGVYGATLPPKSLEPVDGRYSVAAAIRTAEALALEHHNHREEGGRPALLEQRARVEQEKAAAKAAAQQHTVKRLLEDYCDYLEASGRVSHKVARSVFKVHVFEAWPEKAAKPANELTTEEAADMMRLCIEKGHGRTANNLRSCMRAAYAVAKAARTKPAIPLRFKDYRVLHNPVADTEPDETANRADKNPLTTSQLRDYWRAIKDLPGVRGAALRLHVLTGGQRIKQLVELETAKVDRDEGLITIIDRKGRAATPRPHVVPLVPLAAKALEVCGPTGVWAISSDGGKTHLAPTTLSAWAEEVAATLVNEDGTPKIPDFKAKRIRSGIETLLASADVDEKLRGRLQSHGISGVQARSYDGWSYLPQKRRMLETLVRLLEEPAGGNVTQITSKKRA